MTFRHRCTRPLAAYLILLTGAAHACADDLRFGVDLRASGWRTVSFPNTAPVVFTAESGALRVAAGRAAGILWHALEAPRPAPASAQWSWKVEQGVRPTDLTKRGEDDRALAVYFVFGAAEDRYKGAMALLSAREVTCLVYVFGGNAPRSTVQSSPHMGERGKFIILRPAQAPKRRWLEENVEVKADYIRAFGRQPDHLIAVAISSDSDDTRGYTRAQLRGFVMDP
jgi:hypothetical protein